jgi:type I restriction enzyme R subunit
MFNEANSVEDYIRDLLTSAAPAPQPGSVREERATYRALGWEFIPGPQLPRSTGDVLIEQHLHEALVRLNPEIAARPDNADEVLYRLRAIIQSVRGDGLVRANETFTAWLRGEQSRPFGPDGQHVPVRLIDFDNPQNNRLVVSTQVTYGPPEKRFDIVLFVNGIPLVVGETKTPSRPSVSWVDGAHDIHDDYEKSVPAFFVPNVFSFATEGKTYRFGSIRMPLDLWAPWREGDSEVGGHAAPGDCAGHPALLHGLRHRQAAPQNQDYLPLPAISGRQPDCRARHPGAHQERADLAFPGVGQVAADGLCRAKVAPGRGTAKPHRADCG